MVETIIVFVIIALIITGILVNPVLIKWRQNSNIVLFHHFGMPLLRLNLHLFPFSPAERRRLQDTFKCF